MALWFWNEEAQIDALRIREWRYGISVRFYRGNS